MLPSPALSRWSCSATWCPPHRWDTGPLSLWGVQGASTAVCPLYTGHRYIWEKDGAPLSPESSPRVRLDELGTLHISQTWSGDIGTYTCKVLSAGGNDSRSAHLRVR